MGRVAHAETSEGPAYLTEGVPATIAVRMDSPGARVQAPIIGCLPSQPQDALERAVSAAASAEVAVPNVGDTLETSRESCDADGSALPLEQEDPIRRVAVLSPHTVVVRNVGRLVRASWADDVAAPRYAWFPGRGFGSARASARAGDIGAAGRTLAIMTRRDEGRSTRGERLDAVLTPYCTAAEPTGCGHHRRAGLPARFASGARLGDRRRECGDARLTVKRGAPERRFEVMVRVTNAGRDVVGVHVRRPVEHTLRLAGFAGVRTGPGETTEVTERAFARWNIADAHSWVASGRHEIFVGRSATECSKRRAVDL
ncbi:glycoside hydrolase family 3 C-terminal domain-containing protein [Streptomyces acidicola]|uniref:glycoside hydrolase family 3 C-terminal domain-containing protein n=1 Tax=Streptomyces acidicola TaxID=2596892 RepID=UPI00379D8643